MNELVVKKPIESKRRSTIKEIERGEKREMEARVKYNTKTVSYHSIMEVKTPIKSIIPYSKTRKKPYFFCVELRPMDRIVEPLIW
jgi:hypothetical protein